METLTININKQIGGYNFSTSPITRKFLKEKFHDIALIPKVFIAYEAKDDFEDIHGSIKEHLIPILLGISNEKLNSSNLKVVFMDASTKEIIAI